MLVLLGSLKCLEQSKDERRGSVAREKWYLPVVVQIVLDPDIGTQSPGAMIKKPTSALGSQGAVMIMVLISNRPLGS